MLEKTQGIVLHTMRYGEDNMIVRVFTVTRGTLTFMVRVPKGRRSAVKTQLLRPLTILDMDVDYRERVQMHRIKDMHVSIPYVSLPYDPAKEAVAMFLGEVLYHALKHEGENRALFDFLLYAFEWFDLAVRDYANFHICLLVQLTRHLGFLPNMDDYVPYSFFDLMEGCFVSTIPPHNLYLTAEETATFPHLLKMNFATMHRVHLNRQQRGRILKVLNTYYRLHIPEFPELKSLNVLAELFD